MTQKWTEEVEVAPGIYLSKPIKEADRALVVGSDHPEVLYIRSKELLVSIRALIRSNMFLQDYPEDSDCIESIKENQAVVAKQMDELKSIRAKLELNGPHFVPEIDLMLRELGHPISKGENKENGIFL